MSNASDKEIARLKDQVSDLKEQLDLMQHALQSDAEWMHELGLTGKPLTVAALLMRHRVLSRDKIEAALYSSRGLDIPSRNCIEAHVHRARHVLARYGVSIKILRSEGWFFDADSRSKLERLRDGFITAPTSEKKPRTNLNG